MSASDQISRSVLARMLRQLDLEPYEDVIIEVQDRNFLCHRFILSSCSMFFQAMFRSDMRESAERMVELKDMMPETFQLILDCIYGGKNIVNRDNVLKIWQAASLLLIDFLQEACENFLLQNTDKENCIDVYICSRQLNCDRLSNTAWQIILKEFDYLATTQDIFILDADDMERLIQSDELYVTTEDTVVNTILAWTELWVQPASETGQADGENESQEQKNFATKPTSFEGKRTKNVESKNENQERAGVRRTGDIGSLLASLLGASRLCLASSSCLQELLTDPVVTGSPRVLEHVRNALRYHLQPERRYDFCPTAAAFRFCNEWTNVIITLSSPAPNLTQPKLLSKCFPRDKWCDLLTGTSANPVIHEQCNTIVYGNRIFGTTCDISRNVSFMFCYNLQKNDFRFLQMGQNMLKNRLNHTIVCHKNFLYVLGDDNGEVQIDCFNLDEHTSAQWKSVGTLAQAVSNANASVFNNKIIIVGNVKNEGEEEPTGLIQCFDPHTQSTHILADTLPHAHQKRVFLKRWSEVYILQEGGDLWRLEENSTKTSVSLKYQRSVWSCPVDLTSAIIFREELVVLAKPPSSAASQAQAQPNDEVYTTWESPGQELFKRVHILREDSCCLMTTTLPSSLVPNKK